MTVTGDISLSLLGVVGVLTGRVGKPGVRGEPVWIPWKLMINPVRLWS